MEVESSLLKHIRKIAKMFKYIDGYKKVFRRIAINY